MKSIFATLALGIAALGWVAPMALQAGTFKRIAIDGQFADWAGVPVALGDEEDAIGLFDYKDVFVANDEEYLYVRATLHAPADYAGFHHQVILDADNNAGTGHPWAGVGSEMFVEDGSGYQQKNGTFNEGGASGLDWAVAPAGVVTQFEARISRSVVDAEGLAVFTQDAIVLSLRAVDLNWATADIATAAAYEFAAKPPVATGTQTLVALTTTQWKYDDSGTDLGTEWRGLEFDDTAMGWPAGAGLFGFGAPAGVYPAAVQTAFTAGRTTYYLRVPFTWDFDVTGIALVVTNYLSDGAAFYLNGAPVKSLRLPAGDPGYQTPATGGPENPGQAEVFSLPTEALVVGPNVLAVEAHQAAATPAELVFGLSLTTTDSLAPIIEDPAQPADRTVVEGAATTFSVGNVLGSPPFTYQWLKDGSPIAGATSASHTIPVVLFADAGFYSLEITNGRGQKTLSRAAELKTTAVPVTLTDPALPADVAGVQGQTVVFTVAVTGSPLLNYQWLKDGGALEGATGAQLTLPNLALADAGRYSVTVSNRLNAVTSREAVLTVNTDTAPPAVADVEGSAKHITVTFSEPVEEASGARKDNYTVTGGVTVLSAARDAADPRVVRLTTSQQTFGTGYVLSVSGVKDLFGNAGGGAVPFRSTIAIDGDFDDWSGIPLAASEPQDTADGIEFKDFYVANDEAYLYVRFSFHAPVGPLPVDHYYHINVDADGDPATGFSSAGIGVEVMIENGGGYQQRGGGFNEGGVNGLDFRLAPETQATEFECRLSRQATYDSDGQRVFTGDNIALAFELISSSWSLINLAPVAGGVLYTFVELPPLNPGPLHIRTLDTQVEVSWEGGGALESRDSLGAGSWTLVAGASSPYRVPPTGSQRFYRLRQ